MNVRVSLVTLGAFLFTSMASAQSIAPAASVGATPITLQNVTPQCVNIRSESVTFIITGVSVAKKDKLFTKIKGAGGKTDVQLISSAPGKTYSYPAEAALNAQDLGDGIFRAPIAMTILGQYEFPIDGSYKEIQVPFYLLKREGDSDLAKYSRALIKFTAENGSMIPAPGLATAAGLVKDLSDGFFSQLDGAQSGEVNDPDFRVVYQLSSSNTCPGAQFLHSGIFAQIRDTKLKGNGIIKTADQDKYCFYVIDPNSLSPRVGFVDRDTTCSSTPPAALTQLNNPQMVYVVLSVAKTTPQKLAETVSKFAGGLSAFAMIEAPAAAASLLSAEPALPSDEVSRIAQLCELAGLNAETCFSELVSPPEQ